jgi:hypothetical protein
MKSQFTAIRNAAVAALIIGASISYLNAQSAPQKLLVGDTKVEMIASYKGPNLPKPDKILVYGFDVAPDAITMDNSAAARLLGRGIAGRIKGDTHDDTPAQAAEHVNAAFTQTLVNALNKSAISTDRAFAEDGSVPVNSLVIEGSFTTVNEGNKSKRVMIGFGRGASDVRAHVTVSMITENRRVVLEEFNLDSKSGKKPGAAATMGVGSAAAGVAAGSVGDKKETVEGDASRIGKAVAKQIEDAMTAHQWIAAPQAQPQQNAAM